MRLRQLIKELQRIELEAGRHAVVNLSCCEVGVQYRNCFTEMSVDIEPGEVANALLGDGRGHNVVTITALDIDEEYFNKTGKERTRYDGN